MRKILKGRIIKGRRYGRTIGFPTANLDRRHFTRTKQKIRFGIYAGLVYIEKSDRPHKAAVVIGPKDSLGLPKIEAYLFNFQKNLYQKKLSIELRKFIRPYKKFGSEKELVKQIKKDVEQIKKFLS